ncbi:MAG: hypothetical protein Q9165_005839 [Trypethelium subeluteriae]
MSNSVVGTIYSKIIGETALMSQNDFEEYGVEQHTLQTLQETWQKKLSARAIAQFPWDPAPTPPAPIVNPPTVPSQPSPVSAPPPAPHSQGDVRVKTEPVYENGLSSYPTNPYSSGGNNVNAAQQRAAQLLQQQYGPQATASIGALQQQSLQLPGRAPGGPSIHRQQGDPASNQQYLREQEQLRQQQREITNAQTDGAGDGLDDWKALVAERRSEHNMMRAHVEQLAQKMDSGLMVPFTELKKSQGKKRKASSMITAPAPSHATMAQLDGADEIKEEDGEREELDEDAINSDLDDSDDGQNQDDDDDEGNSGEVMLCTYDKVQRVKNKWKCVLKDGVLTTGGKE